MTYDAMLPFETTIRWIKKETRDTFSCALKITSRDIAKSYTFQPGQFNMLSLPGIGEAPISISSAPKDREILHTIRIAGDVTTHLSKLNVGDGIGMRGPFGNHWPLDEVEDRDLMIIAGGLGIAPLRSVIRHIVLESSRGAFSTCPSLPGKKILLYGAKTPKDIIFRDEFPRYKDIFQVYLTVDKADPEEYWKGEVGLIPVLFKKFSLDPLRSVVFMCGPEVMMTSLARDLTAKGVPSEKIFVSTERNMNCGTGFCGHCLLGPKFVCKDGPIFRLSDIEMFWDVREI
ncbi:MAG: FAD/NAD(P)-binding protein [Desulfosoma sp.]